jgi:hypothetical protein
MEYCMKQMIMLQFLDGSTSLTSPNIVALHES